MARWTRGLLLVALVLVGFMTINFAVRGAQHARRLGAGSTEPIQAWMNIRHIAHAYHVRPEVIHQALGLPPGERDRRPLWLIAREQGRSPAGLIADVTAAINRERSPGPGGPGTHAAPPVEQRGAP